MNHRGRRRVAFVGLAAVAVAGATLLLLWNLRGDEGVVRAFKTGIDDFGGMVLLRYWAPGSDELLLCYLGPMDNSYVRGRAEVSGSALLFRYSLSRKTFEPAKISQWTQATGSVLACHEQRMFLKGSWELDNLQHKVHFQGKEVTTAGGIAFQAAIAPSSDLLAVISADGAYIPSHGIFFLGSPPGASGNRFHEVFRVDTAERVGTAIHLEGANDDIVTSPCWAPDNRVVVYFGGSPPKLWFVPFAAEAQERQ